MQTQSLPGHPWPTATAVPKTQTTSAQTTKTRWGPRGPGQRLCLHPPVNTVDTVDTAGSAEQPPQISHAIPRRVSRDVARKPRNINVLVSMFERGAGELHATLWGAQRTFAYQTVPKHRPQQPHPRPGRSGRRKCVEVEESAWWCGWPGLVLWTGCFEGRWLLLVGLCPCPKGQSTSLETPSPQAHRASTEGQPAHRCAQTVDHLDQKQPKTPISSEVDCTLGQGPLPIRGTLRRAGARSCRARCG